VDPYLSRLKRLTPNDAVLSDDPRPLFGLDSIGVSDEAVIDAHIKKADFILITHTHSDHALDLPYIARKTGAMVIGTESTINLARASGVPGKQLLSVKGGADLEFGGLLRSGYSQPAWDSAACAQYATDSGPSAA
jgi:L-ascorbate metabolism protein UlaG (beta-lactamase superfamily)